MTLLKNCNISCSVLSLGIFGGKRYLKSIAMLCFYARIPFSLEYIHSKGKNEQNIILH